MKKNIKELLRFLLTVSSFTFSFMLLSNLTKTSTNNQVENKYDTINDSTDDKYVIIVNNEIKIVEQIKKNKYKDIVTNNIYDENQIREIKGTLNELLSNEEIIEIEKSDYFDDENWMEVYEKVRDKYQVAYCSNINHKDRYLEIDPFSDKERIKFYDEYYSIISSEDIYILDTFAANEINFNTSKINDYYLFIKKYNENNEFDGLELLFEDNCYITIEKGTNEFINQNILDNFIFDDNTQAIYNINDFCNKKGIPFKEDYTISELERFIENVNEKEIEKIDYKKNLYI